MKIVSIKLATDVAEALSQLGEKNSRSRAAELDYIVREHWRKQFGSSTLPVPRGVQIRVSADPNSSTAYEYEVWKKAWKSVLGDSARELIPRLGSVDDFERRVQALCAERGVKWRALNPKEKQYYADGLAQVLGD